MKSFWFACLALLLAACSPLAVEVTPDNKAPDPTDPPIQATSPVLPTSPIQAAPTQTIRADLDDLGPAPELGNQVWLNTDQPLRLADLRGKVVLLDMWTFG
jgi:hypothetical protein